MFSLLSFLSLHLKRGKESNVDDDKDKDIIEVRQGIGKRKKSNDVDDK